MIVYRAILISNWLLPSGFMNSYWTQIGRRANAIRFGIFSNHILETWLECAFKLDFS